MIGDILAGRMEAFGRILEQPSYLDLLRAVAKHPENLPFIVQLSEHKEATNLRRKLYTFLADVKTAAGITPELDSESLIPDLTDLAHTARTLELQVRGDELALIRSNYSPEALAIRDAIKANTEVMQDPGMTVTVLQQRLRDIRNRKKGEGE